MTCLCGSGEWCEHCAPEPYRAKIKATNEAEAKLAAATKELVDYCRGSFYSVVEELVAKYDAASKEFATLTKHGDIR